MTIRNLRRKREYFMHEKTNETAFTHIELKTELM